MVNTLWHLTYQSHYQKHPVNIKIILQCTHNKHHIMNFLQLLFTSKQSSVNNQISEGAWSTIIQWHASIPMHDANIWLECSAVWKLQESGINCALDEADTWLDRGWCLLTCHNIGGLMTSTDITHVPGAGSCATWSLDTGHVIYLATAVFLRQKTIFYTIL